MSITTQADSNQIKSGPVLLIENSAEEQEKMARIFNELGISNELIFFSDGLSALKHLIADTSQPFLIISNIGLPVLSGFQLKEEIEKNEALRQKAIPFIYLSSENSRHSVAEAYRNNVHGFFNKTDSLEELRTIIKSIYNYWKLSEVPRCY